jgi:hypothetical protein
MGYIQMGDDSEGSMYNIFVVASYHTIMHRALRRRKLKRSLKWKGD